MTSMKETPESIALKSVDGESFEVPYAVAMELGAVKTFFDEKDLSPDDKFVPLPNVHSKPLRSILGYCGKQVEFRARTTTTGAERKAYDAEFVKEMPSEELREMIVAANYLDVKGLLEVLLQTVADQIKDRSVEYVREFLGVANDFSPEEETRLREENAWAFEGVQPDGH